MCGIAGFLGRLGAAAPAVRHWVRPSRTAGDDFGIAVLAIPA
jgi:hypothetical protein